jgi:hypothetical protein
MRLMWILTTFCLLPVAAAPQSEPAPEVRPALAVFERLLDRTVARAAPASPIAMLAGPGGSRGYHLRGQGAFFVLPPRRLPTHRPHVMMFRAGPGSVPLAGPGGRELAERMAALHEEAERMNREAERAYRRVRREIEVRYRDAPGETDPAPNEMSDPLPADDPNPFGWQAGPAPPWFFWFESDAPGAEAAAGADELVGEVRAALTAALESQQALMPMLGPDEFVAVAVDFVSDPFFLSGSERPRTLLLRVSRRDIEARRSGRLTAEEFRERIVYEEY